MEHIIVKYFGVFGALLFTSAYIPQIFHLFKVKNSKGISIPAWLVWLIGAIILLIYAIYLRDIVFLILTWLETIFLITIIILALRYKK